MREASTALINFLRDNDEFTFADIYIFTLINGTQYRFTNFDYDLSLSGALISSTGPIIARNDITLQTGIKIDEMNITLNTNDDLKIGGMTYPQAFHNGYFDGARFELYRGFIDQVSNFNNNALVLNPSLVIMMFAGKIIKPEVDKNEIEFNVVNSLDYLSVQVPKNLYQPSCKNTLFDSACKLSKAAYAVNATVLAGSNKNTIICNLDKAQGYFNQGVIEFVDGPNIGMKTTISWHGNSEIVMTLALPDDPISGQNIKLYPGCDKRIETCDLRFNNKQNFAGCPYVPIPETSI